MIGQNDKNPRVELLRIIRQAGRRRRLRLALRGGAVVLAAALAAVLVGSYALQHYAFSAPSITTFRVLAWLAIAAVAVRWLVLPQLHRASDARIALYVEEHEPSLNAALLSAVELGDDAPAELSPAMLRRVVRDAVAKAHAVDDGRRIERPGLRRAAALVAATVLAGVLALATGPGFLRDGATALFKPWERAEAATPYGIAVTPGNVTVPRGADLTVGAWLSGFTAGRVDLLVRKGDGGAFERVPMTAPRTGARFEAILFGLDHATDYQVVAAGVRSPIFHVAVADLPYAKKLELEYHFPAYTGLPPRTVEDGGDVAALRGTVAHLRVFTTRPTPAGRIVLDDGRAFPLRAAADGTLEGSLPVDRDGLYHLELQGPDGKPVNGSPQYTIQALADRGPTVAFDKPGRDTRATSVDEVFLEPRASDDYGIAELELVYAVNGGPEKTVELYGAKGRALAEVSAGHTLYLEELGLQPGDVVAYYARATDNRRVPGTAVKAAPAGTSGGAVGAAGSGPSAKASIAALGPQTATSDIYFVQIRPFRKDYHAAEQRGMPGGGDQGVDGALSEQQKEVVAATFNLLRDRATLSDKDAAEHRATIALAQGRVREQVETLVRRMGDRGVARMDSGFAKIMAMLPQAAADMKTAEGLLHDSREKDALPPEQRALVQLQRAEELYRDVQVSMSQDASGGGGQSPQADDLADLFQLEMDKLRNQYETVQRSQQQQTSQALDETLERLKELAQRQQQAAERQSRLSRGQEGASGGRAAAQAQRDLADQVEEEARRLERLAHEDPQQGSALEEGARRLREAADAVRRAAADPSGAGAQAARDKLDEARRLLERNRTDRLAQGAEDARRRADELAADQQRIAGEVKGLGAQGASDPEQARRLMERKDQLAAGVDELRRQLDRMAADAGKRQQDAARKLADASAGIRDSKLEEKIRYSKGLIQGGAKEYADRMESDISANLDSLRSRLADASRTAATAGDQQQRTDEALDRARRLASGMQSLGERLRQSAEERRLRGDRGAQQADTSRAGGQARNGRAGGQPGSDAGQSANAGSRRAGNQAAGDAGQKANAGGQSASQGRQGTAGQPGNGSASGARAGQGAQAGNAREAGAGQRGGTQPDGRPSGRFSPEGGPGGDGGPPALGPGDVRQFQREARERLAEAEALRRDLAAQGRDVGDLDRVIEQMRALTTGRPYGDPQGLEQLQASVVDGLERFEFGLRRELLGEEKDRVLVGGAGEVPARFRKLVEEYFRVLAQGKQR